MKEYKVEISHIFSHEKNVSTLSIRYLEILYATQKSDHQIKINQAVGYTFLIQAENFMQIRFSLSDKTNGVVTEKGQGNFLINSQEFGKQAIKKQCSIYSIDKHQDLLTIELSISQDLENVGYQDMEPFSEPISRVNLSDIHTMSEPNVTKIEKQISPTKKRHQGYKIRKKEKNVEIVNEIKQNSSDVLQNMKLDMDEAINEIRIVDGKGFIATIDFETNPSSEDLRNIQLKVPENSTELIVSIVKMDGEVYNCVLKLPKLREFESLRLERIIENIEKEKKGKILLNYKREAKVDLTTYKEDRLPMGEELAFDEATFSSQKKSGRFRNKFLSETGMKTEEVMTPRKIQPKFGLKINNKKTKMQSNVISECFFPQIRKVSCYTQQGESQLGNVRQINKLTRYHTLPVDMDYSPNKSNRYTSFQKDMSQRGDGSKIELKYVSIKFHPSYLSATDYQAKRQFYREKYLDIFFKRNKVYRSKNAIGGETLNWELNDCKFNVNQEDTLMVQLNDNQFRTFIGEFRISFNQLKYNYSRTDFLSGDLTDGQSSIGKIKIQFILNDQPSDYSRDRNTQMVNRRRATTIRKKIPSITEMEQIPSERISRRNKHYCQQVEQRNRRPTKSLRKRRKTKAF